MRQQIITGALCSLFLISCSEEKKEEQKSEAPQSKLEQDENEKKEAEEKKEEQEKVIEALRKANEERETPRKR